jgi:hypothetical protein
MAEEPKYILTPDMTPYNTFWLTGAKGRSYTGYKREVFINHLKRAKDRKDLIELEIMLEDLEFPEETKIELISMLNTKSTEILGEIPSTEISGEQLIMFIAEGMVATLEDDAIDAGLATNEDGIFKEESVEWQEP